MLICTNRTVTETYEDRAADTNTPAPVATSMQKYVAYFTDSREVTILAKDHGIATPDLHVHVYEGTTTLRSMGAGAVVIDTTTGDVLVTLLVPMSGRVVLIG